MVVCVCCVSFPWWQWTKCSSVEQALLSPPADSVSVQGIPVPGPNPQALGTGGQGRPSHTLSFSRSDSWSALWRNGLWKTKRGGLRRKKERAHVLPAHPVNLSSHFLPNVSLFNFAVVLIGSDLFCSWFKWISGTWLCCFTSTVTASSKPHFTPSAFHPAHEGFFIFFFFLLTGAVTEQQQPLLSRRLSVESFLCLDFSQRTHGAYFMATYGQGGMHIF